MKWIAIAAVGKNGVIGKGLELPWDIPEDLRFFRDVTRGFPVVMGRITFDSLGKPLPHRLNAVITRDPQWGHLGVEVFQNLQDAIRGIAKNHAHLGMGFVIGGAQIYREALEWVDEVWLTEIDRDFEGDVFFPEYQEGRFRHPAFKKVESRPQQELHPDRLRYVFVKYRRDVH